MTPFCPTHYTWLIPDLCDHPPVAETEPQWLERDDCVTRPLGPRILYGHNQRLIRREYHNRFMTPLRVTISRSSGYDPGGRPKPGVLDHDMLQHII